MTFSIVITTYNRLEFLKRAIASSLNQTIPCEVIVVDDASSDGTEAYVRSLGDRVIYHRNPANLNHSASVNVGVDLATGEWIKFLDDDDYLETTCIEQMTAAISRHPAAAICSCGSIVVDEHETELRRVGTVGPGQVFYVPQAAIHYGMLLDQIPFGTPVQVAARRDAFLKIGGWDTGMTTNYDDIDAWVRLAEHGDAIFLRQPLAYRTVWNGGFERRKDLPYRLKVHIEIKKRIHKRISDAYRDGCPSLQTIERYLQLHWALVALSQRKWGMATSLGLPACLHAQAWQLLWTIRRTRAHATRSLVPKTELM